MKMCRLCLETKQMSCFYKNKANRDGYCTRCKPCMKVSAKKWADNNRDKVRANSVAWLKAHPHYVELGRVRAHEWYWNNRARAIENRKKSQSEASMAAARARTKEWVKKNPDAAKLQWARSKAARRNCKVRDLSAAQWRAILEYFDNRCAYCLGPLSIASIDHIDPVTRGGDHTAANVVPACASCNSKKNDRPIFMMAQHV